MAGRQMMEARLVDSDERDSPAVRVPVISDPPIRVFFSDGYWRIDYGSYTDGFHAPRAEAIATATAAAA
ncbi:MAG: hypothetical protein ACYDHH_33025, partial [Solirubrobacteraceae bacterium]